jgi:hypothetical protein
MGKKGWKNKSAKVKGEEGETFFVPVFALSFS